MRICPKCGSTDIDADTSNIVGIMPSVYVCSSCGYNTHFFPEVDSKDIASFRKKLKKTK